MAIFIGLVFVAYVYVWQRGGLDWGHAERPLEAEPERVPESEEELARAG